MPFLKAVFYDYSHPVGLAPGGCIKSRSAFIETHMCFFKNTNVLFQKTDLLFEKTNVLFKTQMCFSVISSYPEGVFTKVQMATETARRPDGRPCPMCGMIFTNMYEYGPHVRNCGYCASGSDSETEIPSEFQDSSCTTSEEEEDASARANIVTGIWDLARRNSSGWGVRREVYTAFPNAVVQPDFVFDFCEVRKLFVRFVFTF